MSSIADMFRVSMRIFASSGLSNPWLQTASGELVFPASERRNFASSGLSNPRLQTASGELVFPAKQAWWERGTGVPRKASGAILLRADCQIRVCKRQAGNWRSPRSKRGGSGELAFPAKRAAQFCFERIVKSASANGKRGTGVPREASVVGAGNWRSPQSERRNFASSGLSNPRLQTASGELAFPAKRAWWERGTGVPREASW